MVIVSLLLDMMKKDWVEGLKKEIWKVEQTRGHISLFLKDSWGLLTLCGRVLDPNTSGVRQTVLEEAHNPKFSIHPGPKKIYRDPRMCY